MTPVLELTFSNVAGDPWEAFVTARFGNELSPPVRVCEGHTPKQRNDVRWYIEEFMDLPEGGNVVRARKVEQELVTYGRQLWEGLPGNLVTSWLETVRTAGKGRLELKAAMPADEVAFRPPWELLRIGDDGSEGVLFHELGVSVVRRVDSKSAAREPLDISAGLRVLAVICRPADAGFLDPRYTLQAIFSALESCPEVTIDFCRPGTLDALRDSLDRAQNEDRPYHVVHFDGHGDHGVLHFEDQNGNKDEVDGADFGAELAAFQIPLVVLEACRTAAKASGQDTVAGALLRAGVSTVIGMGHAVHVDLTRAFVSAFYERVACGCSLSQAMQAARKEVYSKRQRRTRIAAEAPTIELCDWFVPQLYQGGDDPILLPDRAHQTSTDAKQTTSVTDGKSSADNEVASFSRCAKRDAQLHGFPPEPRSGFQGRGYELHRLDRDMLRHRVVVIHAPGGIGKTSLACEAARWWTRTAIFANGAVFVSLEVHTSPDSVISFVGEALEGFDFHRRKNREEWLTEQLTQLQMLIVWDNFESVLPTFNADRPMPQAFATLAESWTKGNSRLLITSRDGQLDFPSHQFALGNLSEAEGLLLLMSYLDRLGCDRTVREELGWELTDLALIVTRTAGHPLALELLAPFVFRLGPMQVLEGVCVLLSQAEQDSNEVRNRSMWASLEYSIRNLSERARAVLPSLALLSGGCSVNLAQEVVGLDPGAWPAICDELERTGLVRIADMAFQPHPILADIPHSLLERCQPESASATLMMNNANLTSERFVNAVWGLTAEFQRQIRTDAAGNALEMFARSEAVVRRGIGLSIAANQRKKAFEMADAFQHFLQHTGRAYEGGRVMTQLHDQLDIGRELEVDHETAATRREDALARASASKAGELQPIINDLQRLIDDLRCVNSWDTRLDLALSLKAVGELNYNFARQPSEAVLPLQQAIAIFEELEAEGLCGTINRAGTLGDLANTFGALGRFNEALDAASQCLQLAKARSDSSAVAKSEGRMGQLLTFMGRYGEAEQHFHRSLSAAKNARDDDAAAYTWKAMGTLANERNRPDEAISFLHKAFSAWERSGNERGRMRISNALGRAESNRGHLDEALAWYEQSIELAQRLGDLKAVETALTNRGLVFADQARLESDTTIQQELLKKAVHDEFAALELAQTFGHPSSIASSHAHLARCLQESGKLDEAEFHARRSLELFERLNSPYTWYALGVLERIADAQEQTVLAAHYRRLKDDAVKRAGVLADSKAE